MALLTAEEIRDRTARRRTDDVEALGGTVRIRGLSAFDLVRLESKKSKAIADGGDGEEIGFEMIALSWINDAGELQFPALNEKGEPVEGIAIAQSLENEDYIALVNAVVKLNGRGAKAVEEAGKN